MYVLFNAEVNAVNKNLYQFKEYGSQRTLTELSKKNGKTNDWTLLLKNIRETGNTDQRHDSGRPKHARTEENVTAVDELVSILSQEDQTQTHSYMTAIHRDGSSAV